MLRKIALSPVKTASKTLAAAIETFRQFVSPSSFREPGTAERTLIVPVADDGWAPAFYCGEFAVIDTSDTVPAEDGFFLRRLTSTNSFEIVRLACFTEKHGRVEGMKRSPNWVVDQTVRGRGYWDGQYWWIRYRSQIVHTVDGTIARDVGDHGRIHMSDGPLADKHLRADIVGRVIGVLGRPERVLNLKDAA